MDAHRSSPARLGAFAWLVCALLVAFSTSAFAQDDEEDATAEVDEEADDVEEAEAADGDQDDDGEVEDGGEDEEADGDDDDDEEATGAVAAGASEAPPAETTAAVDHDRDEDEDDAAGTAGDERTEVDVIGWRIGDLNKLLGDENDFPQLNLGAYVRGGFGVTYRPNALPANEIDYGFDGRAGLRIRGAAHRMWRARIWIEFRTDALSTVTDLKTFDYNNDGAVEALSFTSSKVPGIVMEQAVASFVPWDFLAIEAGIQRIPFTLQQQSKNTATLFPRRSNANRVFFSGADVGAIIRGKFFDGIFLTNLGVWDGRSLGLGIPFTTSRGVVFSYRADVNPFGSFPYGEGDKQRGPFRLGIGGGVLYRPTTVYDTRSLTEPRAVQDVRLSASLRMAVRGFFVAAEYFRRQQFDNFTFRPQVADGAYAQLAYYFTIADALGLEPSARGGFVNDDQTFDPRLTGYIDAGLSFYPVVENPNLVRIWLTYLGERRFTVGEEAHGVLSSIQIRF
jgi:hypothetical protein